MVCIEKVCVVVQIICPSCVVHESRTDTQCVGVCGPIVVFAPRGRRYPVLRISLGNLVGMPKSAFCLLHKIVVLKLYWIRCCRLVVLVNRAVLCHHPRRNAFCVPMGPILQRLIHSPRLVWPARESWQPSRPPLLPSVWKPKWELSRNCAGVRERLPTEQPPRALCVRMDPLPRRVLLWCRYLVASHATILLALRRLPTKQSVWSSKQAFCNRSVVVPTLLPAALSVPMEVFPNQVPR